MKISYAITVCSEKDEIKRLVDYLLANKRQQDEIVVLYDQKNGDKEVINTLVKLNKLPNFQVWRGLDFEGHFANWKNKLTEYCSGDYIFQIDADEIPHEHLLAYLPTILESNPDNEVYLVPRINTVKGLTTEHIQKWGWSLNDKSWVNFPDKQMRIYKNSPDRVKWIKPVHEQLVGYDKFASLPSNPEYCLYHPKDIKRQERQNKFYDTI